jgi:signal transduction histidine kinase
MLTYSLFGAGSVATLVVGNGDYRIVMETAWWRAWFIPCVSILLFKWRRAPFNLGSSYRVAAKVFICMNKIDYKHSVELFERSNVESEIMLQVIIDACVSNIAVLDKFGTIVQVNNVWRLFADRHGPTAKRYGVGLNYLDVCKTAWGIPADEVAAVADDLCRVLDGKDLELSREFHWYNESADMWFMMRAVRFDLPLFGDSSRILVTHEDVTELKRAQESLHELGGRLISAQEEERKRVALELHDNLNQKIALLSIELDKLVHKIPGWRGDLRACVRGLWAKTQEISSEIHQLSYQLHPSKLDHLDLATAVKSLCDELAEHHEVTIQFQRQGFPTDLPQEVTLCLFRIVQESLNNVIKHSGSPEALVVLERTKRSVRLSVSDKGCGFDTESARMNNGLGFISMGERVRLVGGEISIRSQPSRGTQIDVWVPLE